MEGHYVFDFVLGLSELDIHHLLKKALALPSGPSFLSIELSERLLPPFLCTTAATLRLANFMVWTFILVPTHGKDPVCALSSQPDTLIM